MDMQSEFVQTLEEKAGLDQATAERVAQVATDFGKEHASELISQYGPDPLKSMGTEGSSSGGIGGLLGGGTSR
jgi:hypothetical protein